MADSFLTHSMIAERSLFDLQNQLTMSKHVYRGYNGEFNAAVGGYKKGNSVTVQLPNKFRAKTSTIALDVVDIQEQSTTVTVDEIAHVDWDFLENDLTLEIANFSKKYIRPATITLANVVDLNGCKEYVNLYNLVGTPGTTPATFGVLADAATRMDNEAIPRTDRLCIFSPKAHWSMADGELKGVFQQNIVDKLLRKGFVGNFALMDFFMDQNIQTHLVGDHSADAPTPVMNGSTSEGATSIVTNGWGGSNDLHKGDIITIAGVVGVNPISGQAWEGNELRQFVVTADIVDTSADMTIAISPKIYSSAAAENNLPYQTVVTLPQNGAAITVVGTASTSYPQNMAFHPDCFALTMVPYARPKSAGQSVMWGQASDPKLGLSITVATAFDIDAYKEITRLDILYGWDTIRAELGLRITG
jgi:hypothetical protein